MTNKQKIKYLVGAIRRHGTIVLKTDGRGITYDWYAGPRTRYIEKRNIRWRSTAVVGVLNGWGHTLKQSCFFRIKNTLAHNLEMMLEYDRANKFGPITVYKGKKKLRVL